MGVSKNSVFILIGFGTIINNPFWGFSPIFGNIHILGHEPTPKSDAKISEECHVKRMSCRAVGCAPKTGASTP